MNVAYRRDVYILAHFEIIRTILFNYWLRMSCHFASLQACFVFFWNTEVKKEKKNNFHLFLTKAAHLHIN